MMENWQSEFLQFSLFILATIWFVQKGSNESKQLDDSGLESGQGAARRRWAGADGARAGPSEGVAHHLYANSLLIVDGSDLHRLLVRGVGDGWTRLQRRPDRS